MEQLELVTNNCFAMVLVRKSNCTVGDESSLFKILFWIMITPTAILVCVIAVLDRCRIIALAP
jgi:hypothetical protein